MSDRDLLFLTVLPFAFPVAVFLALCILWKAEAALNRALRRWRRM
ncbi:hypothetical protein AB4037_29145 [Labrys sp. KB_33_2]